MALLGAAALFPRLAAAAGDPGAPDHPLLPPDDILLWPKAPPGGGGPSGVRQVDRRGAVSNIAEPDLRTLRPARANGTAVLITAGGGYRVIQQRKEAEVAARWMTQRGVTAFILSYRLPDEGWRVGPLAPLQDALRALRLIRASAGPLGLDPTRIGCLGFSAGGHLAGLAATRFAEDAYAPVDEADQLPARPDFAVLAYPVITLKPPYDHTSARRRLIGRRPQPGAADRWSVETHVPPDAPPFFLVQARDDEIASVQNSLLMQQACDQAGIPVELRLFDEGGHGFAMGQGRRQEVNWTPALEAWMRGRGFLPP
ncbi:alpha/beta hydrolase [Rhizobium sp. CSW-27]|uniref:alpha/beta hydrolase n=1 Tax=Rhizobium sp. CSW-27 TaxID=2839985 RepID=UPI001C029184|nr:alpha/beta hydrolase [Rhizobium sp. CSW-27]MBT9370332.1 alpha/beta hydrolase [Rhizobium sp. CSW-27]